MRDELFDPKIEPRGPKEENRIATSVFEKSFFDLSVIRPDPKIVNKQKSGSGARTFQFRQETSES